MTDTALYALKGKNPQKAEPKAEDLERIALKKKEEEKIAAMLPVERIVYQNKSELVTTYSFDGIRLYEKRSQISEKASFVYDGRLDKEAASQLTELSRAHPGEINVFYSLTENPKAGKNQSLGVRGCEPADAKFLRQNYLENEFTENQFSVDIQCIGKLEETLVEQVKSILETARKRTQPKV